MAAIDGGAGLASLQDLLPPPIAHALLDTSQLEIVSFAFSSTTLAPGEILITSITFRNNSNEVFQTQGPEPGFVYEKGEWFRGRVYPEVGGAYRVGIDFDGREGKDHPYRWGLGAPLAPGQTAIIVGGIRKKNLQRRNYWAGAAREWIAWLDDRKGTQLISVAGLSGQFRIVQVALTPTTVHIGEQLNIAITVENKTNDTIPTQNPPPILCIKKANRFGVAVSARSVVRIALASILTVALESITRIGGGRARHSRQGRRQSSQAQFV